MNDMKLFLELGVKGREQFASSLRDMSGATSKACSKMSESWGMVDRRMSGVWSSMTKIAALIGGGALLRQAILDVTNFERGLTEMRLTGELSAKEMENIRQKIIGLSSETLQLPEDQLEAFKDMVAAGIDPRQVIGGLRAINRTATATFSNVGEIGKTAVDLLQKMDIKPEKLERAFNIMHKAGKAGRFEIKHMARFFPEVLASASQYGLTGEKGVAQVAAMLQIAQRNRAEPSEAANDMKQFFSHIVSYRKEFKKVGLNVFDFIDLKTGKFKAGKDIDTFFEELKKKTKGGSAAMLKAMGIQDYESSNFMSGMMKDWEDYKKIRDAALGTVDQDAVGNDFNDVKKTKWAQLRQLEIERSKAMKSGASSAVAEKAFSLGTWATENPLKAGGTALGSYAAWKMVQRYFGNKIVGAAGGALETPLFTTSVAGLPALGAGVVGYSSREIGKYMAENEAQWSSTQRLMDLRSRHMVMGGGPNSYQVRTIDQELNRRGVDGENNINLTIYIDKDGRDFSRSDDMNTQVNTTKRGDFFGPLMKSY